MDESHKQIIEYVQQQLQQGYVPEQLRDHMRAHGWTDDWIEWAFAQVPVPAPQPENPGSPQPPIAAEGTDTSWHAPVSPEQRPAVAATPQPQKYKVFQAVGDTFRAVQNNVAGLLGGVGLTLLLLIPSVVLVGLAVSAFVMPHLFRSLDGFTSLIVYLVAATVVLSLVYCLISAVFFTVVVHGISDSVAGWHSSPFGLLKQGLKQLGRLVLVILQLFLRTIGPYLLVTVGGLLFFRATGTDGPATAILTILLSLASMVWILIATLRYALAPVIAVLEPGLPVSATFSRSYHLLKGGGQWFLVKGTALLLLADIPLYVLYRSNSSNSWPVVVVLFVLTIFFSICCIGVNVSLYLNRRAVKG